MIYITKEIPVELLDQMEMKDKLTYYRNSVEIRCNSVKRRNELINELKETENLSKGLYVVERISQGFLIRFEVYQDFNRFISDLALRWKLSQ